LTQELIRQLCVNESSFYLNPFREALNLKSDRVNVADYWLSAYAKVFSLVVGIRQSDSKSICNVTIEQAVRCASVYQTNYVGTI